MTTPAPHRTRRCATTLAVTALAIGAVSALPTDAGAATTRNAITAFGGFAFATTAILGSYNSGNTAVTPLCTTRSGVLHVNRTNGVSIPGAGTVGSLTTAIRTARTTTLSASRTNTNTNRTSLFGQLSVNAIQTVSRVSRTSRGFAQTGNTTLIGGKLAGKALPEHPAVGQQMAIPGVGTLTLNQQARSSRLGAFKMAVTAMQITIPASNALHLPAGRIVIGRGVASLHTPTHARVAGDAYGSFVTAGGLAGSGRTSALYLPCGGSNGITTTNKAANGAVSGVLSTGNVRTYGYSRDTAARTIARTATKITGSSLFGGKVTARSISVVAQAVRTKSALSRSSAGTSVAGLVVNGKSQSGQAPPNTKYSIPNLGTLYANRTIRTANGVQVYGLELMLSVTRNGLKKGTVIVIGQTFAAVAAN